jgi:hypothetical protein
MTKITGIGAMWVGAVLLLGGCAGPHRPTNSVHYGSIHGANYTSAEGGFSVPFPVSAEVGGRVLNDSPQSVTFVDNWGSRISFSGQAVLDQSPMMTMLAAQGREKALSEFARRDYGDMITPHYHPEAREGMISFIYFRPASPRTGVAIFLQGHRLFLAETDMLPGVQLLGQDATQSQSEREAWLESVAVKLAQSIQAR